MEILLESFAKLFNIRAIFYVYLLIIHALSSSSFAWLPLQHEAMEQSGYGAITREIREPFKGATHSSANGPHPENYQQFEPTSI